MKKKRCRQCGENFTPMKAASQLCSEGCRKSRRLAAAKRPERPAVCECGDRIPNRPGPRRRCKRCSERRKRDIAAIGSKKHVRQASENAEPCTRTEIFERDNWTCGLCGGAVARDQRPTHPMAGAIVHCTPLSRGGQHTRANVAAAHVGCAAFSGRRRETTPAEYRDELARRMGGQ
jgi:5-methylcytosine-specific restriction endonuclease McrA